jgi:hypothetical protein
MIFELQAASPLECTSHRVTRERALLGRFALDPRSAVQHNVLFEPLSVLMQHIKFFTPGQYDSHDLLRKTNYRLPPRDCDLGTSFSLSAAVAIVGSVSSTDSLQKLETPGPSPDVTPACVTHHRTRLHGTVMAT